MALAVCLSGGERDEDGVAFPHGRADEGTARRLVAKPACPAVRTCPSSRYPARVSALTRVTTVRA